MEKFHVFWKSFPTAFAPGQVANKIPDEIYLILTLGSAPPPKKNGESVAYLFMLFPGSTKLLKLHVSIILYFFN